MILDVRGTGDAKKVVQLASPLQESNTIQLKYLRFPPMPLVPNFYRAIYYADYSVTPSVDHWFSFDIQTSLSALAHNMSQLEANGVRLFRAFYNETANKFEIDIRKKYGSGALSGTL